MIRRYSDIDEIFRLIENTIRKSLEETRKIFEGFSLGYQGFFEPSADLKDLGDKYEILVDIPGVEKKDIEIYATEDYIEIIAKRNVEKEEKGERYLRRERIYSGYKRIIGFPEKIDPNRVKVEYKDGVLRIVAEKKEKTKKVKITF